MTKIPVSVAGESSPYTVDMTRDAEPLLSTRRPAIFRWLVLIVGVFLILLIIVYALTPFLVSTLAPRFAKRFELKTLEVSVGYPGLTGIEIKRLVIESADYEVHGVDGHMNYSWAEMRNGKIDRLAFARLEVSLLAAGEKEDKPSESGSGIIFPSHPFRALRAEQLVFKVPDAGFVGEGSADLSADGLSLMLDGVEPAVASRFTLLATLSREGVFDARFGERENNLAEFLRLQGVLRGDSVTLSGNFNLSGYPLRLISATAQLPPGQGTVAGEFDTQLNWPLPDILSLSDLTATLPSIAIDWINDDKNLRLEKLSGSATLALGAVTALMSGDVAYQLDTRAFSAHLPKDYQVNYKDGTISGAEGLRVMLTDTAYHVSTLLRAFSFTPGPYPTVNVDGDVDARLDDMIVQGKVVGVLIDQALTVDAELKINRKPDTTDTNKLMQGRGSVAASLQTRIPSPWPEKLSWLEWDAVIPAYTVNWKSHNGELALDKMKGSATLAKSVITTSTQGTVRYQSNGKQITARFPKGYGLKHKAERLTGGAGLVLELNDENTRASAAIRSFSLSLAATPTLGFDSQIDGQISSYQTGGALQGNVTLDDARKKSAKGQLTYTGWIDSPLDRQDITLKTDFALNGDALFAPGNLTTRHFNQLPFELNYDTATSAGKLSARHTFDFKQPVAASLIKNWQEVYDFDSGQVAMEMNLGWHTFEMIAANVVLDISRGRSHYSDNAFTGVSGKLLLRADDMATRNSWRLEPSSLQVARVDMGLPVDELRLSLAGSEDQVQIDSASALLLGGKVRSTPFTYNMAEGSATTLLTLEKISLASVLALEGDDIAGTGFLSGTLPVTINNHQISVANGEMVADSQGGTIRLMSKIPSPTKQASLNFALNALKDFTYTALTTQINYAENGDLELGVQLEGRNPAVEKGRPIRYNLNVSENVPVLLQSLRLQNELTKGIEKQVIK